MRSPHPTQRPAFLSLHGAIKLTRIALARGTTGTFWRYNDVRCAPPWGAAEVDIWYRIEREYGIGLNISSSPPTLQPSTVFSGIASGAASNAKIVPVVFVVLFVGPRHSLIDSVTHSFCSEITLRSSGNDARRRG